MIVSFSVSNFRSFLAEETFSLVASQRLSGKHDNHAIPIPDSKEKVLRTAVLYGANGAGKSNLFKALRYVKSVALKSRKKQESTGRQAFLFAKSSDVPTSFDLQFVTEGKLYRFGFTVNDHQITEEWLVQVSGGREKPLYERVTDAAGKVTVDASGIRNAGKKLLSLATIGGPQNQSFLATVRATLENPDYGAELSSVLAWFYDGLILIGPKESFAPLGRWLSNDAELLKFAGDFLKSSSTGVDHLSLEKKEITEQELRNLLPSELAAKLLDDNSEFVTDIARRSEDGNELLIERDNENRFYRTYIQSAHRDNVGNEYPLELKDESDGTRRLLYLLPALHHLRANNAVYFIDEIDRSMHPMLAWKFLEFFLKSCDEGQRQIIVTTHESNLLDLDLLRRDEIWFVEKDTQSSTRLYSLADFKVRNDLEIRKHYLQGRFGAVPFLGNLDHLLSEKSSQE